MGIGIVNALLALWIVIDGRKRRKQAVGWAIGSVFLGPILAPFWFAKRPLKAGERREGGTAWNVIKWFALLWTLAMAAWAVFGLLAIGESASQASSDAEKAGTAIGGILGMGLIAVIWIVPLFGGLVLGIFLRKGSVVEVGPTGGLA